MAIPCESGEHHVKKTVVKHRGHFRILTEGTSKNDTFGGPGRERRPENGWLRRNLPRGGRAVSH